MTDLERGDLGGHANTAFREAYAEAERVAAKEQLGEEVETATTDTSTTETTPPAETATDTTETEQTAAETLLAGKYKTVEELERGYAELQAFADRQGNDVGESRALLQAYEDRLAALEARPATPRTQITPDLIETNPGQAAQLAYEQGDGATLQAAYEAWSETQPAQAATWVAERRADEREAALRADYDARLAAFEQRVAPLAQSNEQTQLRDGIQALPAETRAFLNDATVVQTLADEFPSTGKMIVEGTPQQRIEAINTLYNIHRGRIADTLKTTEQDVARSTAEAAQQIRDESYVASTTTSEETPKTWEQQEQERATATFARKSAPNWDGALVRPGR